MPLHEVKSTDDSYVHLLITALIRDNQDAIVSNLDTLLSSILESSRGTPLHFIVLTDHTSSQIVRSKISNIVGKQLFDLFIKNSLRGPYIIPRLKVEFVELKQLTDKYREQIDVMKILFGEGQESDQEASTDPDEEIQDFIFKSTDKYLQDLYYISPLFHTEVNNSLNRIIAIDLDLTFKYVYMTSNCKFVCFACSRVDVKELYDLFNNFKESEVLGLANELHPHYFLATEDYRRHNPGTQVGSPGRFQVCTFLAAQKVIVSDTV